MAWRFNGYEDVDGGILSFDEKSFRITGWIQILGKRYEVDWSWGFNALELLTTCFSDVEYSKLEAPDFSEVPDEAFHFYKEHFAGKTFEFGDFDPEVPVASESDYQGFSPNQAGVAGDISPNGSYIEWYSDNNGRCVIEGFQFREIEKSGKKGGSK